MKIIVFPKSEKYIVCNFLSLFERFSKLFTFGLQHFLFLILEINKKAEHIVHTQIKIFYGYPTD